MMMMFSVSDRSRSCSCSESPGFNLKAYGLAILLILGLASLACAGPIPTNEGPKMLDSNQPFRPGANRQGYRIRFSDQGYEVPRGRIAEVTTVMQGSELMYHWGSRLNQPKQTRAGYINFEVVEDETGGAVDEKKGGAVDEKKGVVVLKGRTWSVKEEPYGILYDPKDERNIIFEVRAGKVQNGKDSKHLKQYLSHPHA
ncbi:hypothetical protein FB446DRAFT_734093 [Lentinula raphanica]|nr:hypothetical protein FB446DRAFT_734093 [Lentinula raphanica]